MEELVPVCILHLLEMLESESSCATAHGVVLISIREPERTLALCVLHSVVYNRYFANQGSYDFSMQLFWTKAATWIVTLDEQPMKIIWIYGSALFWKWSNQHANCSSWIAFPENSRRGIKGHGSYQKSLKHLPLCVSFWSPPAFVIIVTLSTFVMKKLKLKEINNFIKITAEVY